MNNINGMGIYIPSLGRAHKVVDRQNVLHELPKAALDACALVVQPQEAEAYRRSLERVGMGHVAILQCPVKGIAATRQWICEIAPEEKVLMFDDDIKFTVHISPGSEKLRKLDLKAGEGMDMLEACSAALDEYHHIGIADRVAASRVPSEAGAPLIVENTRLLRALGYRAATHRTLEHNRVDVMEDFDIALQLIKAGYPSANISWWCQDQRATQWKGGCSTYRTHELHERSARKLAELHPGIVSLRQKENKGGGEFGTRTEVTIQWKKAAELAK